MRGGRKCRNYSRAVDRGQLLRMHVHTSRTESRLSPVPRLRLFAPWVLCTAVLKGPWCMPPASMTGYALQGSARMGGCPYQNAGLVGGKTEESLVEQPCELLPFWQQVPRSTPSYLIILASRHQWQVQTGCRRVIRWCCGSDLHDWHACSVWCKLCGATSSCLSTLLYFHRPGSMSCFHPALCKSSGPKI